MTNFPAHSWSSAVDDAERVTLFAEETGSGDNCIVLGVEHPAVRVVLDPTPARQLVADLLQRLALIEPEPV